MQVYYTLTGLMLEPETPEEWKQLEGFKEVLEAPKKFVPFDTVDCDSVCLAGEGGDKESHEPLVLATHTTE